MSNKNLENAFNGVYKQQRWGKNLGSGPGSVPELILPYIKFLNEFIKSHNIKSIVDLGCGDWQYFQYIDLDCIDYVGYDVSSYIISINQKKYTKDNVHFYHYSGDIQELKNLKAELLICKDVLMHLDNSYTNEFLSILPNFTYALITNNRSKENNNDVLFKLNGSSGYGHSLDLRDPPFNLDCSEVFRLERPIFCDVSTFLWKNKELIKLKYEPLETIHVAYASDSDYIAHTFVSIFSLINNTKSRLDIKIFTFEKDFVYIQAKLNEFKQYVSLKFDSELFKISIFPINNSFKDDLYITKKLGYRKSFAAYIKYFISDYWAIDKCIYLDSDTIVYEDLKDLFNIKLDSKYFAMVKDSKLGFNSGVMLLNINILKQNNVTSLLREFLSNAQNVVDDNFELIMIDTLLSDKVHILSQKYNILINQSIADNKYDDIVVLHFNGAQKPWNSSKLDYSYAYWSNCINLPFFSYIFKSFIEHQGLRKVQNKYVFFQYIKSMLFWKKRKYYKNRYFIYSNKMKLYKLVSFMFNSFKK